MSQVIMITSGKGGVGKSSACVLLGAALGRLGKKVLVLELDSGLRSLDLMMGLQDQVTYDIQDVLLGRCEPIRAIFSCEYCANLFLMPATSVLDAGIAQEDIVRLCRGLSGYFDFVLLDSPAGVGATFEAAARACSQAILVVTPDPVSVRDGAIVSGLLEELDVGRQRLIINRVRTNLEKLSLVPDLDRVIDTVGVQLLGVVPDSDLLLRAIAGGKALPEKSLPGRVYQNIARRILGKYVKLAVQ
ncbi:MAG: P-loop NTPase [Oscillospiraceae bacterium]